MELEDFSGELGCQQNFVLIYTIEWMLVLKGVQKQVRLYPTRGSPECVVNEVGSFRYSVDHKRQLKGQACVSYALDVYGGGDHMACRRCVINPRRVGTPGPSAILAAWNTVDWFGIGAFTIERTRRRIYQDFRPIGALRRTINISQLLLVT